MPDENEIKMVFTKKLKHFLELNDTTQSELANYMKVSNTTINNWVKGYKMPRMDKIDKICTFFNIERSDLIENKSTIKTTKDETDITTIIEQMKERLTKQNLTFEGKPVKPEDVQSILSAIQIGVEMTRKQINDKK